MNKIIPIGGIGGAVGIIAIVVLISTPSIDYASLSCEELYSQLLAEGSYTATDSSEAKKQIENARAIIDIRQQKNCQEGTINLNEMMENINDRLLNPDTNPEPETQETVIEQVKKEPPIDIQYDIDIKFGQETYNSGDTAKIEIDTDSPDPHNVRIGIFDSSGDVIYETIVRTDNFGTVDTEFDLPEYYQNDEELEAIAFFTRDIKDKYTAITLVNGTRITELELDINTKNILSHTPSTVKFALSEAVSKDIMISVFDSDKNSLYMDTVTTNDFGIGKIEFTTPNYYLEDEPIEIIASFVDDPSAERKISSTVGLTKVDFTLTSDKTAYAVGDTVTITVATNPPVSADIRVRSNSSQSNCFVDNAGNRVISDTIQTDASGMYTITGKISENYCSKTKYIWSYDYYYWKNGFSLYTDDPRFEQTNELIITGK